MTEIQLPEPRPTVAQRPSDGPRPWWRAVAQWRNWRLPVKVAAVLAVPAVAAVTLGVLQINGNVNNANTYSRIERLVALRESLTSLSNSLQTERLLAAEKLGTPTTVDVANYYQINNTVDNDALAVTTLGRELLTGNDTVGTRFQSLTRVLGGLGQLHQEALTGGADVVAVLENYNGVIGDVLDFEQAFNTQLTDATLTADATALTDLEVAQEQIRQQQAVVTVAITEHSLPDTELTTMRSSEALLNDKFEDLQVDAPPAELALYERSATNATLNNRDRLAEGVLASAQTLQAIGTGHGSASFGVTVPAWTSASNAAAGQVVALEGPLSDGLTNTAADLESSATRAAIVETVVVSLVLILAITIGIVISRNMLRSLSILRRAALEVAQYRLPGAVANIDKGQTGSQEIEPVPVHTREEFGELARAFDAVHSQAIRSAVGQATLRSNLRNIFINLSRRSQSLVERQLRLMERLERNEEDPQQLANLFRLDHLATRMRRNNENLMVLSGDDPARRSGHPLPLADVLRAAVSEIEQYQRVVVRSTPSVDVLGYASGDLVRLIAELLDNATSFSPPQTQVRVGGIHQDDGSVRIEIRDEGIGMAAPELEQANAKVTVAETDVPVSRQMGLYVVGRLAHRHGIVVSLATLDDGGLLAAVLVPADLVQPGGGPVRPAEPVVNDAAAATTIMASVNNGDTGGFRRDLLVTNRANGTADVVNGNGAADVVHGSTKNGQVTSGLLPASFSSTQEWQTFADRTIADSSAKLEPSGFTWFAGKQQQPPPEPEPQEPVEYTAVGLPRRVPRSHAVPSLVPPSVTGRHQATPTRPHTETTRTNPGTSAAHRSPAKARGFLNDYQAGLRQGRPEAPADDQGQGEGDAQ